MDCPANCRLTIEEWGARESAREATPSRDPPTLYAPFPRWKSPNLQHQYSIETTADTHAHKTTLLCVFVYIYGSICCSAEASFCSYHFFLISVFALFPYNHNIDLLPACKEVGKLALAKVDVGLWEERIKTCSYLFYGRMCKKENGLLLGSIYHELSEVPSP
jgi:hypothetical protein